MLVRHCENEHQSLILTLGDIVVERMESGAKRVIFCQRRHALPKMKCISYTCVHLVIPYFSLGGKSRSERELR